MISFLPIIKKRAAVKVRSIFSQGCAATRSCRSAGIGVNLPITISLPSGGDLSVSDITAGHAAKGRRGAERLRDGQGITDRRRAIGDIASSSGSYPHHVEHFSAVGPVLLCEPGRRA